MSRCSFVLSVKNFLRGLCLFLGVLLVLPDVASSLTIERQKPTGHLVKLKPGEEQEFKVKAKTEGDFFGIVESIDYIEFSAEGNPEKSGNEKSPPCIFCRSHDHKIRYTWIQTGFANSYKVTATVHSKNPAIAPASVDWTVNVGLPPPEITEIVPDLPYREGLLPSGGRHFETTETLRVRTEVPHKFKIEAESEDQIDSIEFLSFPDFPSPDSKTIFPEVWKKPFHSKEYTWDKLGPKTVTATIETKDGGIAKFTWKVEVIPPNRPPIRKRREATIRLDPLRVGGLKPILNMSDYFYDPDSDRLTYEVTLDPGSIPLGLSRFLGVSVEIDPKVVGVATFTVTASDGIFPPVEQKFSVEVRRKEPTPPPPPPVPDLIVVKPIDITPNKTTFAPGEEFTLSATVRNIGTARARSGVLRYYEDFGDFSEVGDTNIKRLDPYQTSNPDRTSDIIDIELIAPEEPGNYRYEACVSGVRDEVNKDNNCSYIDITVGDPRNPGLEPPNRPPVVKDAISLDGPLTEGGSSEDVDVLGKFSDPDGDRLTYTARSGNRTIVTVERVSGSQIILRPEGDGTTRIYVTASDGTDQVTQFFEITVNPEPEPVPVPVPTSYDLEILPLSVSQKTITPGGSFTLFVTIRNNGPDTSGSPALSYYRKRTPTDRASFIGTVDVEPLASGESIRKEIEIDIPLNVPSTPITYYYLALLAANIGDTNFSNNQATAVSVTVRSVQAPRVPDLVVESISVNGVVRNQVVLTPGEDFRLGVVVENQGEMDAPSTSLRYYRSLDATLSPNDDEVGSDRITTPDAGQTYDKWEILIAPNTPGVYYYGACVDSVTDESDVNNNCSEAIEITVQTARPPDLVITSVSVDSLDKISLETDDTFELTAVVENQGEIEASSTKLRYYLSSDKAISTADEEVDTRNVRALEKDDTYEGTKTIRAPDTPGVYYYGVCVDSVTGESHLTNNCSAESIEVTVRALPMPDLIVSVRASKVSLAPRETFTLYATVKNQGTGEAGRTILRYHDPTGNEIGTARIKSLSTTETSDEENIELQAPNAVGTYHYEVCVDSLRDESDVLNNCSVPLAITVGQRTQGVCDRTPEVRDEILAEIDIEDCATVSSADLEEITSLGLSKEGITALKVNDFQGLTSLDDLRLLNNSLRSLPVGIFDGLTALEELELHNNSLSSLPVGVFNELGALYALDLGGNSLSSLSVGVFDGLTALEHLVLDENSLRSLPAGVFDELRSLRILELNDNSLGSLPVGVFNGLSALGTLDLTGNSLSSLPIGIFDGLTALENLDLSENSLTSLPVGIFDGLDALRHLDLDGNQITTLPVGIFDDILDTLGPSASYVDFDSLKTTFGFSTTTQDAAEGDTVRIMVNLGRALPVAVRVPYTLGGTATTADYTGLQTPTELLFLAGETSKEIVFTLLEDADTTAETLSFTLSELSDVKLRKSDGSGSDAKLSAYALLNAPQQRVHTVTVTTGGEGVSRPMYWTAGDNKIRRSQLDGTQVQVLFEGGNPGDLALDISGGKMYWVDTNLDAILRANLDGSHVVNLIADLSSPTGLALDISGGKIYWLDYNLDKIQRANLNGSGREDLVTGLDRLMRIALDTSGGKMYWTDRGTGKIQRANLNGTNVEDLVTGLNAPRGIALDVSGGKMYWTDTSTNKIQRANLNGTNVEDLVTSIDIGASGLALDVSGGKMYWADNQVDKVCRANLNGTQIERLYAGGYPKSIALAIGSGAVPAAPLAVSQNPVGMFPSETALLPNYPNPFNPDTWIPYQLSKSVDVTVSIYSVNGTLMRTLALGHQPVGIYQNRQRAAYWDGRNAFGERVASGLYFYTLTAGDFSATRKLLIRK